MTGVTATDRCSPSFFRSIRPFSVSDQATSSWSGGGAATGGWPRTPEGGDGRGRGGAEPELPVCLDEHDRVERWVSAIGLLEGVAVAASIRQPPGWSRRPPAAAPHLQDSASPGAVRTVSTVATTSLTSKRSSRPPPVERDAPLDDESPDVTHGHVEVSCEFVGGSGKRSELECYGRYLATEDVLGHRLDFARTWFFTRRGLPST
jgi:hypothetical protein